jgi:anthrone oxygenase-like protein
MVLKVSRFVAVMLAALTLGMGFCHLMQLPARMGWDQYLWVGSTVQGGLYNTFGSVGALIDVAAAIALALLAYFVREHGRPGFRLALAAALLFALALVLWWVLVYPVNVELAKWVNGPVPSDWTEYRSRWEWGHAIISLLELAGFAALIALVLTDTSPQAEAWPKSPPPKKRSR